MSSGDEISFGLRVGSQKFRIVKRKSQFFSSCNSLIMSKLGPEWQLSIPYPSTNATRFLFLVLENFRGATDFTNPHYTQIQRRLCFSSFDTFVYSESLKLSFMIPL